VAVAAHRASAARSTAQNLVLETLEAGVGTAFVEIGPASNDVARVSRITVSIVPASMQHMAWRIRSRFFSLMQTLEWRSSAFIFPMKHFLRTTRHVCSIQLTSVTVVRTSVRCLLTHKMGRKRRFEEDHGSTSDSSVDEAHANEEGEWDSQFGQKRRNKRSKEDEMLGIFAESDDEPVTRRKMGKAAPSFVKSNTTLDQDVNMSESNSDSDEAPRIPKDAQESEQDEATPHFGLGMATSSHVDTPGDSDIAEPADAQTAGQIPIFRAAGLRNGPALRRGPALKAKTGGTAEAIVEQLPTSFGKPSTPEPVSVKPPGNVGTFEKHTKGIGARLLAKMGWKAGGGLGKEGEGIVEPIDVKVRPKNLGLAFNDFKEQTKSVQEIEKKVKERHGIRYGDLEKSSDEELAGKTVGGKSTRKGKSASAAPRQRRIKTSFKTVEELEQFSLQTGMKIIDMTGPGGAREIANFNGQQEFLWQESVVPDSQLIADLTEHELDNTVRRKAQHELHETRLINELQHLTGVLNQESERLKRLRAIRELVGQLEQQCTSLKPLSFDQVVPQLEPTLKTLHTDYLEECRAYSLTDVIVASFAPFVKRLFNHWLPLEDNSRGVDLLQPWITHLNPKIKLQDKLEHEAIEPSAYDALICNVWLPRVRMAINNDWNVFNPEEMVSLLEIWYNDKEPLISEWIFDTVMDTLVLPKLTRALSDWHPKTSPVPLHTWLLPWFPLMGEDRMKSVCSTVRQRLIAALQDWKPRDGVVSTLEPWKSVLKKGDFDAILVKAILPKLTHTLKHDLLVDPSQQDVAPIQSVFVWSALAGSDIVARILTLEFFPRWHNVLWKWLSFPKCDFSEVATWYSIWKRQVFPAHLLKEPLIAQGFKRALDLMNVAMEVRTQHNGEFERVVLPDPPKASQPTVKTQVSISFKDYLEQTFAEANVEFAKSTRLHEVTGKQLHRAKGNQTVYVYIDDGVLFINRDGKWQPIDVDSLIDLVK